MSEYTVEQVRKLASDAVLAYIMPDAVELLEAYARHLESAQDVQRDAELVRLLELVVYEVGRTITPDLRESIDAAIARKESGND
jgi:prophage DNA circulation protein